MSVCVCFLLAGAAGVRAEVVKGEVKKVDGDKGILTVAVKGVDREFYVPADAEVTIQVAAGVVKAKEGLKNPWFKRAAEAAGQGLYRVEVTLEKKEGKEAVTKLHLFTPTRRE
jgi:hypothetical protein